MSMSGMVGIGRELPCVTIPILIEGVESTGILVIERCIAGEVTR